MRALSLVFIITLLPGCFSRDQIEPTEVLYAVNGYSLRDGGSTYLEYEDINGRRRAYFLDGTINMFGKSGKMYDVSDCLTNIDLADREPMSRIERVALQKILERYYERECWDERRQLILDENKIYYARTGFDTTAMGILKAISVIIQKADREDF